MEQRISLSINFILKKTNERYMNENKTLHLDEMMMG